MAHRGASRSYGMAPLVKRLSIPEPRSRATSRSSTSPAARTPVRCRRMPIPTWSPSPMPPDSVVAYLGPVPNQPLAFDGDGVPRWEDDLVGYNWARSFTGDGPKRLVLEAMTKSAVRAMDTVTAIMARPGVGRAGHRAVRGFGHLEARVGELACRRGGRAGRGHSADRVRRAQHGGVDPASLRGVRALLAGRCRVHLARHPATARRAGGRRAVAGRGSLPLPASRQRFPS